MTRCWPVVENWKFITDRGDRICQGTEALCGRHNGRHKTGEAGHARDQRAPEGRSKGLHVQNEVQHSKAKMELWGHGRSIKWRIVALETCWSKLSQCHTCQITHGIHKEFLFSVNEADKY